MKLVLLIHEFFVASGEVPASSTRGGHNKKLTQIGDNVLKDYLHMCHGMGRSASIENAVAACNSILRVAVTQPRMA
jgi:hypothetical protein